MIQLCNHANLLWSTCALANSRAHLGRQEATNQRRRQARHAEHWHWIQLVFAALKYQHLRAFLAKQQHCFNARLKLSIVVIADNIIKRAI